MFIYCLDNMYWIDFFSLLGVNDLSKINMKTPMQLGNFHKPNLNAMEHYEHWFPRPLSQRKHSVFKKTM